MTYSIRLPEDIENRLEKLVREIGCTKSFYIRQVILDHLDDIEDVYIAEKRLEDNESGCSKSIPLEEVMKEYGLDS